MRTQVGESSRLHASGAVNPCCLSLTAGWALLGALLPESSSCEVQSRLLACCDSFISKCPCLNLQSPNVLNKNGNGTSRKAACWKKTQVRLWDKGNLWLPLEGHPIFSCEDGTPYYSSALSLPANFASKLEVCLHHYPQNRLSHSSILHTITYPG